MAYQMTADMQYTLFMGDPEDLIREREGNLVRGHVDTKDPEKTESAGITIVQVAPDGQDSPGRPDVSQMLADKPDGVLDRIWEDPEWGNYYIRPAAPPRGSFEHLYFEKLRDLILRKWRNLFPCCPVPGISRIELLAPSDLEPDCPFAPVQGILVKIAPSPSNKIFMKPGRLQDSLAKNCCKYLEITKDQIAVTPFFEWELAEFWQGGLYELD